ncbi:unnamed protein product [Paramecium pentaurelia]|uniref:EamA domain-containing protein n=1 Tax=Paramecium pentaurelia TaxID=43138 RepID=A0A8S1WYT3_9CILI|nr:unnamed protein product [Paramecium pentaurelia]
MLKKITISIKQLENTHTLQMAIAYMLIAYFFHAVQATFYKCGHFTVVPQFMFVTSFISFITLHLVQFNQNMYPKEKMPHIIRSQVGIGIGTLFYFYGVNLISLSEAVILFCTNSIWSQIMVSIMNKEGITKSRLFNSILCIIGVILIANPSFQSKDPIQHIIGCLCILICSIIQSYAFIIMKQIGTQIPSSVTVTYFNIIMLFLSSLQQQYIAKFEYFEGYFFYTLGFSTFTLLAQIIKFRAQTMVTYDKICNYSYSQMIYIIIIDFFVFHSILSINGAIGALCIISGVYKQLREDRQIK